MWYGSFAGNLILFLSIVLLCLATFLYMKLGLEVALVPLEKFPNAFPIFQWKCPLQNQNGLALSKKKFRASNCHACKQSQSNQGKFTKRTTSFCPSHYSP